MKYLGFREKRWEGWREKGGKIRNIRVFVYIYQGQLSVITPATRYVVRVSCYKAKRKKVDHFFPAKRN